MGKVSCIYAIVSPSGKAYIGSTANKVARWRSHKWDLTNGRHHCDALSKAHAKYGMDGLSFIVLEECAEGALIEREQWWMDGYSECFPDIYNSSLAAGRTVMKPEVRQRLSNMFKGREVSKEAGRKISIAKTGTKASPEAKAAMRKAALGRKHSEEVKRKIGDARRGRKYTKAHRDAMSKGLRGKIFAHNTSGVPGVSWNNRENKWKATIYLDGKEKHLGYFTDLGAAAMARQLGELFYWNE